MAKSVIPVESAKANSGDIPMQSFGKAVEKEFPRLRKYARTLTRNVVAADDLVQDTLVRALAKQHLWQEGTDFRSWLFTILHNLYVNGIRKAVREGSAVEVSESLRAPNRTDDWVETSYLDLAMQLLPTDQREVIELVGIDDLSYEQTAIVLGIPVGTVRSRLSRGRELLRMLYFGVCKGESGYNGETLRSITAQSNVATSSPRMIEAVDEWPEEFEDEY